MAWPRRRRGRPPSACASRVETIASVSSGDHERQRGDAEHAGPRCRRAAASPERPAPARRCRARPRRCGAAHPPARDPRRRRRSRSSRRRSASSTAPRRRRRRSARSTRATLATCPRRGRRGGTVARARGCPITLRRPGRACPAAGRRPSRARAARSRRRPAARAARDRRRECAARSRRAGRPRRRRAPPAARPRVRDTTSSRSACCAELQVEQPHDQAQLGLELARSQCEVEVDDVALVAEHERLARRPAPAAPRARPRPCRPARPPRTSSSRSCSAVRTASRSAPWTRTASAIAVVQASRARRYRSMRVSASGEASRTRAQSRSRTPGLAVAQQPEVARLLARGACGDVRKRCARLRTASSSASVRRRRLRALPHRGHATGTASEPGLRAYAALPSAGAGAAMLASAMLRDGVHAEEPGDAADLEEPRDVAGCRRDDQLAAAVVGLRACAASRAAG